MNMTVIDDVIKAEQEAEAALTEARNAAAQAVADAKARQSQVLADKAEALQVAEVEALAAHRATAESKAASFTAEAASQISAIEQRFQNQSADIASKIKQAFQ